MYYVYATNDTPTGANEMTTANTFSAMSDHQVLEMAEVMLADDHSPADCTATYVAAYNEAMRRPTVKSVLDIVYPTKES